MSTPNAADILVERRGRVSRSELQRRWSAVRQAMSEHGVDAVVAHADYGGFGGYARYLSGLVAPLSGGLTVVFPLAGGMTVIEQGADGDRVVDPDSDALPGVERVVSTPYYPNVVYTDGDEGRLVAAALTDYRCRTVGLAGRQQLSTALVDHVKDHCPQLTFVDAGPLVDPIMAVKSQEEREFIRATGALQDQVIQRVLGCLKPGVTERDIALLTEHTARELGAEQGFAICASAPVGQPVLPAKGGGRNRTLERGDFVQVMLEGSGPGGFYAHLVRGAVLGEVPRGLTDEFDFALAAQHFTLDLLRPGAQPAQIMTAYNDFLRSNDRPAERRFHAHGHGYDVMERPLIRAAETMPIMANMNIGCHPTYLRGKVFAWVCSNYLTSDESPEPIHHLPTEILSL